MIVAVATVAASGGRGRGSESSETGAVGSAEIGAFLGSGAGPGSGAALVSMAILGCEVPGCEDSALAAAAATGAAG
jgi:hypothetical protein